MVNNNITPTAKQFTATIVKDFLSSESFRSDPLAWCDMAVNI